MRRVIPLLIGVALAAVVGGVSSLFDFSAPVMYALGGVVLVFVVIFGTPYAFGAPPQLHDSTTPQTHSREADG